MPPGAVDNGTLRPRPKRATSRAGHGALVAARAGVASGPPARGYGVPAFREGFVRRPALLSRLLDARDAALALVAAPPGYGKSTLLAEWAQFDERPFIWIRLKPDDASAAVAGSIAQAFEQMGWIDRDVWPALASSSPRGATSALRRLMHSVRSRDHAFVVVLDDAHTIRPSVLKAVVMAVLEQLAEGSQLALASRTEPPLPIGRLRAHRALVEVRTPDLIMTPAEAATLLRLVGLELDFESVQALSRRTEGWPAGLYLAALSLLEQGDVPAALKRFDGEDHLVAEYLRDEFLAPLPAGTARFVIRTSVLDDLSGPLCDAVLRQSGSAVRLGELARCNLMLSPLGPSHERFRWHGLFRAMLRAELRRTEPELGLSLHRRASTWLERYGELDEAIGQAVAAGDAARTGDLLWANIVGYAAGGSNEKVQGWLRGFSADQIGGCAQLALAAAHSCLLSGNVDHARRWRLMAAAANERRRAARPIPSFEAGAAIFDAMAASVGAGEIIDAAARACELEPQHGPWRPFCSLLRGVGEHLTGNRARAKDELEEGVRLSSLGAPSIASLCLAQLVMMAIERDDWDAAGELADRAAGIVGESALAAYPISSIAFAASAATRAHQGRADEAKRDLRHGADLLAALGDFIPWYGAEARIMLARAALGLADTVRARTLLAEASRLGRRTPDAVIFQRCFEQAWAQIDTLAETALSGPSSLTIAELRILRFLPSHRSFREIAERLDVSVNTVKTQAHAIYRKLDAASRSEAVARASRAGLLGT